MQHEYHPGKLLSALLCIVSSVLVIPDAGAMINRDGANTVRVTFADLDLSKRDGLETLYRRLKTAARKVCGARDFRVAGAQRQSRQCYAEALTGAVQRIDNQQLSARHLD